jgi:hypothetical protein
MLYDQFVASGGVVKLTNLRLPEPAMLGASLLMFGVTLFTRRRRLR